MLAVAITKGFADVIDIRKMFGLYCEFGKNNGAVVIGMAYFFK
jgi:hypothetical protein